jgi:DNA polymerase
MENDILKGLERCRRCLARKEAKKPVPAIGNLVPGRIMVVGRNPRREEDESGIPFVGKSGKFLDEYLLRLGLNRENVYITNTVKCHTRANREPDILEINECTKKWLDEEVRILKPKIIIILGADAYRGIFKCNLSNFTASAGCIRNCVREKGFHAVILPHPSAVISYRPSLKSKYDDLIEPIKAIIKMEKLNG